MYKKLVLLITGVVFLSFSLQSDFLTEQKRFQRVRTAIEQKQSMLEKTLKEHKLSLQDLNILLVAYKENDLLDIYAKSVSSKTYSKLFSYKICARSGQPGPKRKQGDGQVPEGFYHIDRFNPTSNFYLSLGLNYPNTSDRIKSEKGNTGGDIFIHGSCVTIGCLPMTDDVIKEIYLLAVHAKNNGQQKIPVYIFPFKMTDSNMSTYKEKYSTDPALLSFWKNLKTGYDHFTETSQEIRFSVSEKGDYVFR